MLLKTMKLTLLFCIFTFISATQMAQAEVSEEMKTEIRKMLDNTEIRKTALILGQHMGQQNIQAIERSKKQKLSEDTKKLILNVATDVFKEAMDQDSFYEIYYGPYAKHFTLEDLKKINNFYQTPTGQKALKATPLIMQEILPISQKWAVSLLPKLEKRLKEELSK